MRLVGMDGTSLQPRLLEACSQCVANQVVVFPTITSPVRINQFVHMPPGSCATGEAERATTSPGYFAAGPIGSRNESGILSEG